MRFDEGSGRWKPDEQVFILALSLIRTRVGDYTLTEAIEPEAFGEALFGEAQPRKREWRGVEVG